MKRTKNEKPKDKITVFEYEDKYSSKVDQKKANGFFNVVVLALGILIIACAFGIFKDVYEINEYAGYAVGAILLIAIIVFFVVPVVSVKRKDKFSVDVTAYSARRAKRHNAKLRRELAEKIVECYTETSDGSTWYGGERVSTLAKALNSGENADIRTALDAVYLTDVKKASRGIITRCAVKSGTFAAISQKSAVDSLLVTAVNLQMIKDLVFLYGFRPSDARLLKIFAKVVSNSLAAYGLGNVKVGNAVVKTMGDVAKSIPILGSAISVLVDGSVQGLGNATLTAVIGHNTVKYLMKEYRLQNILDDAELVVTEDDFELTCKTVKEELSKKPLVTEQAV